MSQAPVKWVHQERLVDEQASVDVSTLPGYIPVIPLSALREVVEFIQEIVENAIICTDYSNGHYRCIHCGRTNEPSGEFTHLDDCETHTAQRLLAILGEE